MNIPIHIPFITHAKKTNFYPHIPKKIGNMEVSMGKTQARLGTAPTIFSVAWDGRRLCRFKDRVSGLIRFALW